MCVILVGTKKQLLSIELNRAWKTNADGAGFSYVENKRVRIVKGLMAFDAMIEALENTRARGLISLHLRLATHGRVCAKNTHPFAVGNDALAHNGVLSAFGVSGASGVSDSADLARVLSALKPNDRNKVLASLSGMFALTTARAKNDVVLFGSRRWEDYKGVQCSNLYWIADRIRENAVSVDYMRNALTGFSFPDYYNDDDDANALALRGL